MVRTENVRKMGEAPGYHSLILVRQELRYIGGIPHYWRLLNVVDTDDSVYDF